MNRIVTVIIICAFTLASIVLAVMGTGIYKMSTDAADSRALCNTSAYFTRIIRECEDTSAVRTASVGGSLPALVLRADAETDADEIWYFTYNGYLRKLPVSEGQSVSPDHGTEIMPLSSSDFVFLKDELLDISFEMENGGKSSVKLYLPDRKGDQ